MSETPHRTPQEIIDLYKAEFGAGILDARITERGEGVQKTKGYNIWIRIDRNLLKPAIRKLMDIRFPHFAVIAGSDLGDEIELLYILSVFYDSYNLDGPIDQVLPVDVYVPGCPPRPEAIIFGVVKALEKLERLEAAQ